ncbi:MAG: hypothetical protein ACKVJD_11405, partial [Burkholderiales bacterium]
TQMTPVLALLTVPLPVDEGLWAGAGLETASFVGGSLTCAPVDGDFFPVGVFGAAAPAVTADTCAPEAAWAVAAGALVCGSTASTVLPAVTGAEGSLSVVVVAGLGLWLSVIVASLKLHIGK